MSWFALAALSLPSLPHTLSLHLVGPPDALFAWATRFAGDVDGDGYQDVLVYAIGNGPGLSEEVYVRSGATGHRLYLYTGISNPPITGVPIDGAGDVNGDGFDDFLIGNCALNQARLYSGRDGSVLFEFTGNAPGDSFGAAVAGVGDIDGDGRPDVMVGTTSAFPGYATVYSGADGSVVHTFVGSLQSGLFGCSVSAVGDVDGDGVVDLAVGATDDGHRVLNPGFPPFVPPFVSTDHVGVVHVYSGLDGHRLYKVFGQAEYEGFGYSIDGVGDVDGDGLDDFVVGTLSIDDPSLDGYARVVSGADGSRIFTLLRDPDAHYRMVSVSAAGDVDHDGVPDVLVGAAASNPADPDAQIFSGRTGRSLFRYAASTPPYAVRITVDGGHDLDHGGTDDFVVGVFQAVVGLGYVDVFVAP